MDIVDKYYELYGRGGRLMDIVDKYYDWLLDRFCGDTEDYECLMGKLFSTKFRWKVPFDENRASDGVYLRYIFVQEVKDCTDEFDSWGQSTPCSFLEMLCAFSKKIEDYLGCGVGQPETPERWFWLMLDNCGLEQYDNAMWDEDEVDRILDVVMDRKYKKDGLGGLWPVIKPEKDQRKVDLWYQANTWFIQNHANL